MATKIVDIIRRSQVILLDELSKRWPNEELLNWYNDAIRQIVILRPDASTMRYYHVCTGETRQTLNQDDIRLIEITHNRNGGVIHSISREILDAHFPNWHAAQSAANAVEYYAYDERYPTTFYLYPLPAPGVEIEIVTSRLPAPALISDFVNDLTEIQLHDIYTNPVIDYMLFRAFSKDSSEGSSAKAATHYQLFKDSIADKSQADGAVSPTKRFKTP